MIIETAQAGLIRADLDKDLAYSFEDRETFDSFYKSLWPNTCVEIVHDMNLQRMGVDVILHWPYGRILYIDEKKERENYPNIFLQTVSNKETEADGWMIKNCLTDYVASFNMARMSCYLIPFLILQNFWKDYGPILSRKFEEKEIMNHGWITKGYAIPINQFFELMGDACVCQFKITNKGS